MLWNLFYLRSATSKVSTGLQSQLKQFKHTAVWLAPTRHLISGPVKTLTDLLQLSTSHRGWHWHQFSPSLSWPTHAHPSPQTCMHKQAVYSSPAHSLAQSLAPRHKINKQSPPPLAEVCEISFSQQEVLGQTKEMGGTSTEQSFQFCICWNNFTICTESLVKLSTDISPLSGNTKRRNGRSWNIWQMEKVERKCRDEMLDLQWLHVIDGHDP